MHSPIIHFYSLQPAGFNLKLQQLTAGKAMKLVLVSIVLMLAYDSDLTREAQTGEPFH